MRLMLRLVEAPLSETWNYESNRQTLSYVILFYTTQSRTQTHSHPALSFRPSSALLLQVLLSTCTLESLVQRLNVFPQYQNTMPVPQNSVASAMLVMIGMM